MPIAFSCPSCDKKLRVNDAMAGKKGKCPSCDSVFRVPDAIDELEDLQDLNDRPVRSSSRSRRPVDDDDDVEESPRPKKKKRRRSSGGGVAVVVTLGLLVLLGIGASVWWFWGSAGPSATQLRYTPDNCMALVSVNIEGILDSGALSTIKKEFPDVTKMIDQLKKEGSDEAGLKLDDISRVTVAVGKNGDQPTVVGILELKKSTTAADLKKGRKNVTWKESKAGNHTIYEPDSGQPFCLPESDVCVMGDKETLEKVLKRDGKAELPEAMKAIVKEADFSKSIAVAINLKALKDAKESLNGIGAFGVNPLAGVDQIFSGVDGFALTINIKSDIDISAAVVFKDSATAEKYRKQIDDAVSEAKKEIGKAGGIPGVGTEAVSVVEDLINSVDVSSSGPTLKLSMTIKVAPIVELAKSMGGGRQGFGGFIPNFGGFNQNPGAVRPPVGGARPPAGGFNLPPGGFNQPPGGINPPLPGGIDPAPPGGLNGNPGRPPNGIPDGGRPRPRPMPPG